MQHFARSACHVGRDDDFAGRVDFDRLDVRDCAIRVMNRTLVGHREFTDVFELVTEEFETKRVLGRGWKNVEDAASNSKFTALGNHVNAVISHFDELQRKFEQQVILALLEG